MTAPRTPIIRALTMQKNESALLEPWILWHGALFGFGNLTVVDNGSTDPHVRAVQAHYAARGVRIIRKYRSRKDFLNKGDALSGIIREWDARGEEYDFALPMDCDEFLAYFLERLSVEPADILAQFDPLKDEKATLLTDRLLLNVPGAPDYYRPQSVPRALFRAGTAKGLDRGLHAPRTPWPERWVRTPFVHIHLHNRPDYEEIRRFARQKLGSDASSDPKISYHLRYYFNASREDFLRSYRDVPDIYAPAISARLRALGVDPAPLLGDADVPRPPVNVQAHFLAHRSRDGGKLHEYALFDPLAYAHENPDVARDAYYGIWPLIHYMDAGWNEGRRPNPLALPPLVLETANDG